jgi:threonine aldolase
MHLDGARLLNASVASGLSPAEICSHFDTVSICFSKGLGCPMGSVLVGNQADIAKARRIRKLFGGALRQAGMMAASALYALEHNVRRLKDDHDNAKLLARGIADIPGLSVESPVTNLVYLSVNPEIGNAEQFAMQLRSQGILISPSGRYRLRACTHLDVSTAQIAQVLQGMRDAVESGFGQLPTLAEYSGPYSRG